MAGRPCSICAKPILRRFVDAGDTMTASALSREAAEVGLEISPDRILNHRHHLSAAPPEKRHYERASDFAARVERRASDLFDEGKLDLTERDHAPGITAGLKASAILDTREKAKKHQGSADLAFAIIAMLTGQTQPISGELDDGMTIEGESVAIDAPDDDDASDEQESDG